jgi:hypothetical protein
LVVLGFLFLDGARRGVDPRDRLEPRLVRGVRATALTSFSVVALALSIAPGNGICVYVLLGFAIVLMAGKRKRMANPATAPKWTKRNERHTDGGFKTTLLGLDTLDDHTGNRFAPYLG